MFSNYSISNKNNVGYNSMHVIHKCI